MLNLMNEKYKRNLNETEDAYCHRVWNIVKSLGGTWEDATQILNENLSYSYSPSRYRHKEYKYLKELSQSSTMEDSAELDFCNETTVLDKLKIEKSKIHDELTQVNAYYRRIAREETIKEIAIEAAELIKANPIFVPVNTIVTKDEKVAILPISDWHYGIEIDSYWNTYNPEIAEKRISKLQSEVINLLKKEDINQIIVLNLGDLISGRIHLGLRLQSRIDVITQTMKVSELVAQFLSNISEHAAVHYYDCLDNHSRVEPNLKDSLELESLVRIIPWYLKERLSENMNVDIHENSFSDDIITFNVLGHNVAAVHGHKDNPVKVVENMTLMLQHHFDLICTAHYHHFSAEEKNETVVVSSGTLMGTDEYAQNLRLHSKPSQNLIICTETNACQQIYKINLE